MMENAVRAQRIPLVEMTEMRDLKDHGGWHSENRIAKREELH